MSKRTTRATRSRRRSLDPLCDPRRPAGDLRVRVNGWAAFVQILSDPTLYRRMMLAVSLVGLVALAAIGMLVWLVNLQDVALVLAAVGLAGGSK